MKFFFLPVFNVQKSAENATSPCLQYKILCCIKRDVWNNGGTTFLARPKLERECTESRAVIMFLQNKVFISFQLNHRNGACLHYLPQSLISFSLITCMRQELQIKKNLRCINEMGNESLFVTYNTYGRDTRMCQRKSGEHQYSLYILKFRLNYPNTAHYIYHKVSYAEVWE